jgi:hypothetical protein
MSNPVYAIDPKRFRENAGASGLTGYIDADYRDLVTAFGVPHPGCDKSDAEWYLRTSSGDYANIYNYKTGPNYLGSAGLDPTQIRDWHVGGCRTSTLPLIQAAVDAARDARLSRVASEPPPKRYSVTVIVDVVAKDPNAAVAAVERIVDQNAAIRGSVAHVALSVDQP